MKKEGETLREIRLNQRLEQQEIYSGILSKSSYIRIENDQQSANYKKIRAILQRLDLTLGEFEFILNNYQNNIKYQFISRFKQLKNTTNQNAMTDFITDLKQETQNNPSEFLIDLTAILESLLLFQQTQSFEQARHGVQYIWNKIEKKNDWNFTDILLMANIFFIFDAESIDTIVSLLTKAIHQYKDYPWITNYNVSFPLNYCLYLRKNHRILECIPYLERVLEICKQEKSTINYIDTLYRLAEIDYVKGDREKAQQTFEQIKTTLLFLEEKAFLQDLEDDWQELQSLYPTSII